MNDITSKTIAALIEAQSIAATASGTGVATAGAAGSINVIARVGTPTGTTPTLSLQVETSADNSTGWTAVGAPMAYTTTGGTKSQNVDPASSLGFIRVTATVGGTTPVYPLLVLAILTSQYK
jgi:hypothetical protein